MGQRTMDKRMVYILAGVLAVLVLALGIEIGIDSAPTTGIDLRLSAEN